MKFKNQIKLLENSLKKLLENEAVEQNINSSIKLFCSAIKSDLTNSCFWEWRISIRCSSYYRRTCWKIFERKKPC